MWSQACVCPCVQVYVSKDGVCVCLGWQRMSVQSSKCACKDIWSKKHAKPLETGDMILMFKVKSVKRSLSSLFTLLSCPKDVKKDVLSQYYLWTQLGLFLSQVETYCMINYKKHANWLPLVCKKGYCREEGVGRHCFKMAISGILNYFKHQAIFSEIKHNSSCIFKDKILMTAHVAFWFLSMDLRLIDQHLRQLLSIPAPFSCWK